MVLLGSFAYMYLNTNKIRAQELSFIADTVCFGEVTHFTAVTTLPDTEIQEFQWDINNDSYFDDGNTSTITYQYTRADTFPVSLRILKTDNSYLRMDETIDVIVHPLPETDFTADFLCYNSASILRSGTLEYSEDAQLFWDLDNDGDYDILNDTSISYIFPSKNNTVKLKIINSFGCSDSTIKSISLADKPTASFEFTEVDCPGDTVWFRNLSSTITIASAEYYWKYGDSEIDIDEVNPGHAYDLPGSYTVTLIVITEDNCSDTAQNSLVINPGEELTVVYEKDTLYMGESTALEAQGNFVSYYWSTGDSTSSIVVNRQGDYTIEAIDEKGCRVRDTIKIIAFYEYNPNKLIAVNNILTPNNDGFNDYLEFLELEAYGKTELTVYNQWGFQVFYDSEYNNDWDGKNEDGNYLESGTYFYVIKSKDAMGKGSINILRE